MLSKITLSNNFMEIQMGGGGGSLNLEILSGGGLKQFWKSRWMGGGGGQKPYLLCRGGVDFFWNNPFVVTSWYMHT